MVRKIVKAIEQVFPKIESWSFSRYSVYEKCARQAKYKFIDKLQEPPGAAMLRGKNIDEAMTRYYKGQADTLPVECDSLMKPLQALKKTGGMAQFEAAYTKSWGPTSWFMDRKHPADHPSQPWLRVKMDFFMTANSKSKYRARVIDFKTGKIREGQYDDQLELYGLGGLLSDEKAKEVSAELWFTDHGVVLPNPVLVFKREDLPALQKKWIAKTKRMLNDTIYPVSPGNECRWCHFRKSNGGPCSEG